MGAGLNSTKALCSFHCSAQVFRPLATASSCSNRAQPACSMVISPSAIWRIEKLERDGGVYRATVSQDTTRALEIPVGRKFEKDCDSVFGDPDTCKKDLTALTVDNVVVETIVEDLQTFRATSGSLPGTWNNDDFRHGEVTWKTGNNKGKVSRVMWSVAASREFTLFDPTPFKIVAGDTFTARGGCGGQLADCVRHDNVVNFAGNAYQMGPKETYLQATP